MVERCDETPAGPRPGEPVGTKLHRIAEKARKEPTFRFTSLFHLMNEELLRECFDKLRGSAAEGIDEVTKAEYAKNLEANLADLAKRLQRMGYRPQPVRRVYIPKPGTNKQRPLGIPCLAGHPLRRGAPMQRVELVQAGLARILGAIYEQDFIRDSYAFRPGRGAHDALLALSYAVEQRPVNHVVEADITGFFDNVSQDWLMRFLEHRIGDRRTRFAGTRRMVRRFLKAGIVEDGAFRASDEGTPQGGVISPMLGNVYLHYVLDLWFERRVQRHSRGYSRLIRYADDFLVCFEHGQEATRFQRKLVERLAAFGLAVEPSKTKVVEFGRLPAAKARAQGRRLEPFDFLGVTHYCGTTRRGSGFRMKRVTARKRFTAKLRAFKQWLKRSRTIPLRELWPMVRAKLRGHFQYYGMTDNGPGIGRFRYEVTRLLFKWLNRRGGRHEMSWEVFNRMLKRYPLPTPRVYVNLIPFYAK